MAGNSSTEAAPSAEDDDNSLELLPLAVLVPAVLIVTLVVVVAAGGNLLVIASYIRDSRLRTVSNLYLLHLALCDLLLATVSMPFYLAQTAFQWQWPFGQLFCKVYLLCDYTLCAQSVFLVILISLDQLIILRAGVLYASVETKGKAYVKVALAWLVSFLIYGPAIIGWDRWVGYSVLGPLQCDVEFYSHAVYTSVAAVLEFVLPAVALTALNSGVYYEIRKRTEKNLSRSVSASGKEMALKSVSTSGPENDRANHDVDNTMHVRKASPLMPVVSSVESLTERFRRCNQVTPVGNTQAGVLSEQAVCQNVSVDHALTPGETQMAENGNSQQTDTQETFTSSDTALVDLTNQKNQSPVVQDTTEADFTASANTVPRDSLLQNGARFPNEYNNQRTVDETRTIVENKSTLEGLAAKSLQQARPGELKKTTSITFAVHTEATTPPPSAQVTAKNPSMSCFPVARFLKAPRSQRKFNKTVRKDLKAARALFIFVLAFLLLWTPYTIATVVIGFCEEGCVNENVYEFFVWLLWFKAAVNPFVYAANNSRFKMNFFRILQEVCFCCKNQWSALLHTTVDRHASTVQ